MLLPACRSVDSNLCFTGRGHLSAPIAPATCCSVFPSVPAPLLELRRTVCDHHFHVAPLRFRALSTLQRLEQTFLLYCAGLVTSFLANSDDIWCSPISANKRNLHFWTSWRCASACESLLCHVFWRLSKKASTFQHASTRVLRQCAPAFEKHSL